MNSHEEKSQNRLALKAQRKKEASLLRRRIAARAYRKAKRIAKRKAAGLARKQLQAERALRKAQLIVAEEAKAQQKKLDKIPKHVKTFIQSFADGKRVGFELGRDFERAHGSHAVSPSVI